jgi:ABC-type transporter Mla MlaB component
VISSMRRRCLCPRGPRFTIYSRQSRGNEDTRHSTGRRSDNLRKDVCAQHAALNTCKTGFRLYCDLNSASILHLPNNTMLRISTNESEGNVVTLRVEGQIVGAWISELDEACERVLAAGHKVIRDLGDVSLIDRRGLTLLASLSRQAVALVRCSPFQEEQLRLASLSQPDKPLQSR